MVQIGTPKESYKPPITEEVGEVKKASPTTEVTKETEVKKVIKAKK